MEELRVTEMEFWSQAMRIPRIVKVENEEILRGAEIRNRIIEKVERVTGTFVGWTRSDAESPRKRSKDVRNALD